MPKESVKKEYILLLLGAVITAVLCGGIGYFALAIVLSRVTTANIGLYTAEHN